MRVSRKKISLQAVEAPDVNISLINPIIQKYQGKKGNLIPVLQGVQSLYGYVPREAFIRLNEEMGLKLNEMYGVATFYAQFRLSPVGKHIIKVCHGTACHVQNATKITEALVTELGVNDGHTTEDGLFTLESVACLGCCSLAPVMMVGNETFGSLTGKKAARVIKELRRNQTQP